MTTDPQAALDALAAAQAEVAALEAEASAAFLAAKEAYWADRSPANLAAYDQASDNLRAVRAAARAGRDTPAIVGDVSFTPEG